MPHYYTLGKIPPKRHTQFRQGDGRIVQIEDAIDVSPQVLSDKQLQHRAFEGFNVSPEKDYIKSRKPVLVNSDVHISLAAPSASMTDYFFKNTDADECIFIHEGSGTLYSMYGELEFKYGDYVIIPRGTLYKMEFDSEKNRHLVIESFSPITPPKRYVSNHGQFLEHSPYCERDIKKPKNLKTYDEVGDYLFMIKKEGMIYPYHYKAHPFDVIGWDGQHYPHSFSIHDFEPITGRVHQPPPVHQTFAARGFVICSFVPRLFDYHPLSIPAPYNHSNIDSDEMLYYVDGDFMSRKSVSKGMITLHPGGIPHGPHPGTYEASIGQKETKELAVMVDTFKPLKLTKQAFDIEIADYHKSWLD